MTEVLPETSRQLQATLAGLGCRGRIRQLPDSTHSANDAAAAIGCAIDAIASSLLFMADDSPLLVMVSGAHRVDTDRVAQLVGALKVRLAPAKTVAKITGQIVGGVAPVGHRTRSGPWWTARWKSGMRSGRPVVRRAQSFRSPSPSLSGSPADRCARSLSGQAGRSSVSASSARSSSSLPLVSGPSRYPMIVSIHRPLRAR